MRSPVSLGFLTPDPSRISAGRWIVGQGDDPLTDPAALPDWDYFTDVTVERELDIDLNGLRSDCQLADDSELVAVIMWHSTWTNLRGAGSSTRLRQGTNLLSVSLPGTSLGGHLNLEARVLLGQTPTPPRRPSPHRPGSTLWADATRVDLEGVGTRFPVVPIPFDRSGLAGGREGAAWALVIESHDLAASASGVLRLYLNSSHNRIRQLLQNRDGDGVRDLREMIHYDIARQLVHFALLHDDLEDGDSYEDGTLGSLLVGLIRRNFPQLELEYLRAELRNAPGELDAELQAQIRLLSN